MALNGSKTVKSLNDTILALETMLGIVLCRVDLKRLSKKYVNHVLGKTEKEMVNEVARGHLAKISGERG